MFDRIPRGPATVAIAGGVMFACIPLTPAMGLIGIPAVPTDVAQAGATVAQPVSDARSPLSEMTAAQQQREIAAAQEAKRRALELQAAQQAAAALGSTGGSLTSPSTVNPSTPNSNVDTGGPIPTTAVTTTSREIQSLVKKYFPADQLGNAMAVAACESGHSNARGAQNSDGTTDWGVFQLNDGGTLQSSLDAIGVSYSSTAEARQLAMKTEINVRAAASIYGSRGWAPWVCAYKIGVVAGLYSNAPGPMDGKFDAWGKPTVDVPVVNVDPGANNDPDPDPKPTRTPKPDPTPTRTPKPDPTPTPSRTPSPKPTKSPSQSPVPPTTAPASPSQPQAPSQPAGQQPSQPVG